MTSLVSIAILIGALAYFIVSFLQWRSMKRESAVILRRPVNRAVVLPPSKAARKPLPLTLTVNKMRETAPAWEIQDNFLLWCQHPVIEALYSGGEAEKMAHHLQHLVGRVALGTWFVSESPSPMQRERERRMAEICLKAFAVREDGRIEGFREALTEKPRVTLGSMDIALRLLLPASPGLRDGVSEGGQVVTEAEKEQIRQFCIGSLEARYDPEDRRYKIEPAAQPGPFATFAALGVINNLWRYDLLKYGNGQNIVAKTIKDVPSRLTQSDLVHRDGFFAFTYRPNRPCLSTTEYMYRAATFLGRLSPRNVFSRYLADKGTGTLGLVHECWVPEAGGFKRMPVAMDPETGKSASPTLMHTRYALQLLRTLLARGDVRFDELAWLRPTDILRFIRECWTGEGFGNQPGEPPSLCSLRAGINSMKLLEIFRLNGVFRDEPDYHDLLRSLAMTPGQVSKFVDSCYDERFGTYWAFKEEQVKKEASLLTAAPLPAL